MTRARARSAAELLAARSTGSRCAARTDAARLVEAVAAAFARGDGEAVVRRRGRRARATSARASPATAAAVAIPTPEPALFSFNTPLGACPTLPGLRPRAGARPRARRSRPATHARRRRDRAVRDARRASAASATCCAPASGCGLPTDVPWASSATRSADSSSRATRRGGDWYGVRGFFEWLECRRYKVQARVLIARYRRFDPCPSCERHAAAAARRSRCASAGATSASVAA